MSRHGSPVALVLLSLLRARASTELDLCSGVVSIRTGVCCTKGCGQSRLQCSETEDVCKGSRRGDATTKANCCPSTIRAAGKKCAPGIDPPCVLDGNILPGPSLERPPAPAPPVSSSSTPAPVPCSSSDLVKNGSLPAVRDSAFEMCADFCKPMTAHCSMCKCKACIFCQAPAPPPLPPAPVCAAHSGVEGGGVCCKLGCGQSRVQCAETPGVAQQPACTAAIPYPVLYDRCKPDICYLTATWYATDVCHGTRRGDATTKAGCCPSVIRAARVACTAGVAAPCALPDGLLLHAQEFLIPKPPPPPPPPPPPAPPPRQPLPPPPPLPPKSAHSLPFHHHSPPPEPPPPRIMKSPPPAPSPSSPPRKPSDLLVDLPPWLTTFYAPFVASLATFSVLIFAISKLITYIRGCIHSSPSDGEHTKRSNKMSRKQQARKKKEGKDYSSLRAIVSESSEEEI